MSDRNNPDEKRVKRASPTQRKYLRQRLQAVRYARDFKPPKEPAHIKRARKLVASWDSSMSMANRAHYRATEMAFDKALEILNFGTPEAALAAVKQFEEFQRTRRG